MRSNGFPEHHSSAASTRFLNSILQSVASLAPELGLGRSGRRGDDAEVVLVMTGVLDFLSPHSQVSLLSIPEGEIHLVIPLRVDTFAHCGQFGLFEAARTFQNKGPCIAEAGEGGPLQDEPVCPAPRGVALSAVCLQPPSTTPKTSQEPLKMDPLLNEEDSQCAEEEEEVDPRIQGELEKLNQSTDDINRWESELEDCRQRFRAMLREAAFKLDELAKRLGRAVDDSKPYWEARKVARQAQIEAQKATQEFQRAVEILRAAKETIALAEERLLEEDSRQFDSAWQEMLNHATQRVMEAEQSRTRSEAEHKKTAANYNSCISHMRQLEKKLKRSINKSRPYFELKAKYYLQLEQLKALVEERQAKLVSAKAEYRAALRNLESISEEIHAQRRSLAMGTREQGVGAEGDAGDDDIANFKMESDGLSMMSVSIDEGGSHSNSSEDEADNLTTSSPRASSSSSTTPSSPLDMPSPFPSLSPSLCSPCSYLPSTPPSTGLGALDLESPCSSHDVDSVCGSGHVSPLLGPRSQCSGASSPDCEQERGDRAEGAEATLESSLNKLTLTVAQEEEGDSGDDPPYMNPELSSPATNSLLLLNGV